MSASRLAICIALLLVVACESETATEPLSGSRAAVVEGPDVWSCYDPEDPIAFTTPLSAIWIRDSSEAARVDVIESRNVGSGSFPMVGTVSSIRPLLYQGTENLWAYQPFCGWDGNSLPSRNNCSSAYAAILDTFGFSGT